MDWCGYVEPLFYTLESSFVRIPRISRLARNRLQRARPVKKSQKCIFIFPLLLLSLGLWPQLASGTTQTVELPVTLDFRFIRSMLIHQAYTSPKERLVLEDEGMCARIELWDPEVSQEGGSVKTGSKISFRFGVRIFGWCINLVDWAGYVEVLQRPQLEGNTWRMRLETVDSRLYDRVRKRPFIAGVVWDQVKSHVHAFMDRTRIDLSLPVRELKDVLPLFFADEQRDQAVQWLDTLRAGDVTIGAGAVRLSLLMDVSVSPPAEDKAIPAEMDEARLRQDWKSWDPFFVYQITALAGQTLEEAEIKTILNTLLEMRHRFVRALDGDTASADLVRKEFSWAWNEISGVLRKYLLGSPSPSLINHLAFVTVSDALTVLERLGAVMQIEMSREGLMKAARLLSETARAPELAYSYEVDPRLRKLLGFGPLLNESGPALDVEELDLPESQPEEIRPEYQASRFPWFSSVAFAADKDPTSLSSIQEWLPPRKPEDFSRYLEAIGQVLQDATDQILSRSSMGNRHHPMFRLLVQATAWQESCWRQFVIKDQKVKYLLSYNQTSIGLMQINERVWRGIYRVESLRWNIRYNAMAGAEILDLYLRKYVLADGALNTVPEADSLAGALYAMYNGGPGALRGFMGRDRSKAMKDIDRLFSEKYDLVKRGKILEISICHFGESL